MCLCVCVCVFVKVFVCLEFWCFFEGKQTLVWFVHFGLLCVCEGVCVRRVLVLLLKENSLWVCSFFCVFANVFICFRVLVSFERETLFGLYILYVFARSGFLRCLKENFFWVCSFCCVCEAVCMF